MSHLETTEVVSVHFDIVKNGCQEDLRVLHTFVSNKSFNQLLLLLDISPRNFIFFKTFNSEFSSKFREKKVGCKYRMTLVEHMIPIIKLNLKLKCQSQFYVITVMHT